MKYQNIIELRQIPETNLLCLLLLYDNMKHLSLEYCSTTMVRVYTYWDATVCYCSTTALINHWYNNYTTGLFCFGIYNSFVLVGD